MKKLVLAVLVILAIVSFADLVLAEGDIGIGIKNKNYVAATATGGNAEQQQTMNQSEWQTQTACGGAGGKGGEGGKVIDSGNSNSEVNNSGNADVRISGVEGGKSTSDADADASAKIDNTTIKSETTVKAVEGDVTNQNIYISPENKRPHINAPTGPSGSFLNGVVAPPSKEWEIYICDPFLKTLTYKQLKIMSKEAGGFFSSGISKSLMVEEVEEVDESPLVRLDFMPEPTAQYLGEFRYESDDPIAWGAVLGHALLAAKRDVNAKRVVVWKKVYINPSTSGLSLGSGAAGSLLGGKDGDAAAGAVGLGGLLGKTSAKNEEVYGVLVRAFGNGPIDPPPGVDVCGLKVSAPTAEVEEEAIIESTPPCDPRQFEDRIVQLKEAANHCLKDCFNNMLLWKQIGDAFLDWYECGGRTDNSLLTQADSAYARSEKNCIEGHEADGTKTSSMIGAQQLLYKVKYNRSWCILLLEGPDAQMRYGEKEGLPAVPEFYHEIKR